MSHIIFDSAYTFKLEVRGYIRCILLANESFCKTMPFLRIKFTYLNLFRTFTKQMIIQ